MQHQLGVCSLAQSKNDGGVGYSGKNEWVWEIARHSWIQEMRKITDIKDGLKVSGFNY